MLKRLPAGKRGRLSALMPELLAFTKDTLQRVQGPPGGTSFALVLNSEEAAIELLRVHKEKPFTGVFEAGGEAIPIAIQPDRERWLQKYLTLQWPVLEHLRGLPAEENTSMNKCRMGDKRQVRIYGKEENKEILRLVGTSEYKELNEDGPEPNEWVSFTPGEGVGEVGKGAQGDGRAAYSQQHARSHGACHGARSAPGR